MQKFKVKTATNLQDAMVEANAGISRQKAKKLLEQHDVYVNGKKVAFHKAEIKTGDLVELKGKSVKIQGKSGSLRSNNPWLVWEDKHLVVAFKPAGIITSGADPNSKKPSFHKVLEKQMSENEDSKVRLWIIHRLDREVEGLILFAKSEEVMNTMKDNWKTVSKKYWALTEQKPDPTEGTVSSWLKDSSKMKVHSYHKEVPGSKWAVTNYRFVKNAGDFSLVEIDLDTGRKNQIRVHLADLGCPIVGDRKYGADESVVRQIRLSAIELKFNHPVTKSPLSFRKEPAKSFFKPSDSEDERYKKM